LRVAERIGVAVVEVELIEIAGIAEKANVHLAFVVLDDEEARIRHVSG